MNSIAAGCGVVRVRVGLLEVEVGRKKSQLRFYSTLHCSADFGPADDWRFWLICSEFISPRPEKPHFI